MKNLNKHIRKNLPFITAIWAALCPLCYLAPLLVGAGVGSVLIFTAQWGEKILIVLLAFSTIAFYTNYKTHKNVLPILAAFVSGAVMYYSRYINFNLTLLYVGSGGFFLSAILDTIITKKAKVHCENCNDINHGK